VYGNEKSGNDPARQGASPIKIIHVITDLKIGGESKHLVRVLASLPTLQHIVSCLAVTTDPLAAPGQALPDIEALGVPVVDLGVTRNKPLSAARALVRLQRLVHGEKPNLIHSTLIHANLLSQALPERSCPLICSHVLTNPWRRNWHRTVERRTARRAIFVANSRAVAESLMTGGLDRSRIRVLYYGVDCDHFSPVGPRAQLAGEPLLLGVGRLHPQKGFDDLLRAAASLPSQPDVLLIGDGPLREQLIRCAHALGVKLSILPAVGDIAPYLRRASVVVLPSRYEGLPNVLLEALATERAVVASDLPGHREVIRDGKSGILTPPSNVPALTDAIRRALRDDGSLGAEGRRTVLERFPWQACIERRRLLYESIATRESWPRKSGIHAPGPGLE
jgi:glycosyltransferase involved in cell wall biosynthesis